MFFAPRPTCSLLWNRLQVMPWSARLINHPVEPSRVRRQRVQHVEVDRHVSAARRLRFAVFVLSSDFLRAGTLPEQCRTESRAYRIRHLTRFGCMLFYFNTPALICCRSLGRSVKIRCVSRNVRNELRWLPLMLSCRWIPWDWTARVNPFDE
jgi:hypothetical protein